MKIIIIKRFYNETAANLYRSKLSDVGIESFVSNSISSTMIPMIEGGFILHIRESDKEKATEIIAEIDRDFQNNSDLDFRDADLEDINYEKEVWEYDQKLNSSNGRIVYFLLFLIIIIFALYKFFVHIPLN